MLARFSRAALALTLAASAGITAGAAQTLKKMTLVQMHPIMGVGEEVFLYAVPKHLHFSRQKGSMSTYKTLRLAWFPRNFCYPVTPRSALPQATRSCRCANKAAT